MWNRLLLACLVWAVHSRLTIPLHQGIHKSALYSITVYIGSQLSPYEVQVDTGSATLAVPCIACQKCPGRYNNPFDPANSTTYQPLYCNSTTAVCQQSCWRTPKDHFCPLDMYYVDDSWIVGDLFSDMMALGPQKQGEGRNELGCINNASDHFHVDPTVDGIWGVGKGTVIMGKGYLTFDHYLTQLSKKEGASDRLLTLCMAEEEGEMNIGGINEELHNPKYPAVTFAYDHPDSDSIGKSIRGIKVGTKQLHENAGHLMPHALIDSGTTTTAMSKQLYKIITDELVSICTAHSSECRYKVFAKQNQFICFFLTLASNINIFPPIFINFAGTDIPWYAENYLITPKNKSDTLKCIHFEPAKNGPYYLLGNDFMIDKDIVYGRDNVTIYAQSRCKGDKFPVHSYGSFTTTSQKETAESNHDFIIVVLILLVILAVIVIAVLYNTGRKSDPPLTEAREGEEEPRGGTDVRLSRRQDKVDEMRSDQLKSQ